MFMHPRLLIAFALTVIAIPCAPGRAQSHPPLRQAPAAATRALPVGDIVFVDAQRGDDAGTGTIENPLRSINQAARKIKPGTTISLRGGIYYEQVYISAAGTPNKPITITSHPGETAIIDGGVREFHDNPASAWQLVDGTTDEYRSTGVHPNLHIAMGWFADSMIGLNTYYHAADLRAAQELVHYADFTKRRETDHDPLYCGPGIWYEQETGRLHARFAHTHVEGIDHNYAGQTDARKLPLIIAPFSSVPLTLDGCKHVTVRDVVIRGGGHDTVKISLSTDVTLDNVTVWAGSYGAEVFGTQRLKLHNCGFYGSVPPWLFRSDTSKRDYPGRPTRNITRLNTHALLVPRPGIEFDVYASPVNDDWEISHCEFTDAHDAIYLGGVSVRFHHNLIDNMQDDGIYLSPMYQRHVYAGKGATSQYFHNVFRQTNMPLAFGGPEENKDILHIYRNIFDLRRKINYSRGTTQKPAHGFSFGAIVSDHGSPPWAAMFIYHNTCIMAASNRDAYMRLATAAHADRPRHVFNNILFHLASLPTCPQLDPATGVQADGNLTFKPDADAKAAAKVYDRYQKSDLFLASRQVYAAGFTANDTVGDPKFRRFDPADLALPDVTPTAGSAAIGAGVPLPAEWPDTISTSAGAKPDIGAVPGNGKPFRAGRVPPSTIQGE